MLKKILKRFVINSSLRKVIKQWIFLSLIDIMNWLDVSVGPRPPVPTNLIIHLCINDIDARSCENQDIKDLNNQEIPNSYSMRMLI